MIGSFLYPKGYAATKRKQQFLDYIVSQGDFARVLITLKWAKGNELNDIKGTHNGIPYELLGVGVKKNALLPITFLIFILRAIVKLINYRKEECKNIIISFGVNFDTIIPLIMAKLLRYKIIFDIVEDSSSLSASNKFKNKIKYWCNIKLQNIFLQRLASGMSVITSFLEEKYIRQGLNIPIKLIPVSASNINLKLEKRESEKFKLLYSGTYGEKEGLPILFEAFRKFKEINNSKLVLTGNCPEHIVKLLKQCLSNLDDVIFTGRLGDEDYYQTLVDADVLLMTRANTDFANAGFPYKLGEYLATGNSVICTNVSDISKYLINMKNAVIIYPDDVNALFEAMRFIKDNPIKAIEIGKNGFAVCEKYFNPQINSGIFYELLNTSKD